MNIIYCELFLLSHDEEVTDMENGCQRDRAVAGVNMTWFSNIWAGWQEECGTVWRSGLEYFNPYVAGESCGTLEEQEVVEMWTVKIMHNGISRARGSVENQTRAICIIFWQRVCLRFACVLEFRVRVIRCNLFSTGNESHDNTALRLQHGHRWVFLVSFMVRIKSKYDTEGFASYSLVRKKHKLPIIVKKDWHYERETTHSILEPQTHWG